MNCKAKPLVHRNYCLDFVADVLLSLEGKAATALCFSHYFVQISFAFLQLQIRALKKGHFISVLIWNTVHISFQKYYMNVISKPDRNQQ